MGSYSDFGCRVKYLLARNGNSRVVGGAGIMEFRLGPLRWLQVPHGPSTLDDARDVLRPLLRRIEDYALAIGSLFIQIEPYARAPFDDQASGTAAQYNIEYSEQLPSRLTQVLLGE